MYDVSASIRYMDDIVPASRTGAMRRRKRQLLQIVDQKSTVTGRGKKEDAINYDSSQLQDAKDVF